jgi:Mor family transcriptional regulator
MSQKGTTAREVLPGGLLKEVQRYFSGGVLYIPSRDTSREMVAMRNKRIKTARDEGRSVRDLAERFNLSEGHVYRLVRED